MNKEINSGISMLHRLRRTLVRSDRYAAILIPALHERMASVSISSAKSPRLSQKIF